ncbi:NrfD/PsrC family molybdoenzyme membrane anchor subunit [Nonomuraea typhae]|uniref:NrfD/PsrC family molybdoenzyme membrane anchor subunit n=1 Tax=Nonomuraea typhae TaxID=2603600 RepID=UPI0012FA0260|nr:NrfD/PsrC family molybdoenzyme membrane anchor subunit [Nonomuraea typhae]
MDDVQHFAGPPDWLWYILFYFVLAGLSGGSYLIATLIRLRGSRADEPMARIGFYVAFPPVLVAPILLALDLGQPWRFWHMLWNTTPGAQGPNFKAWSPMSIGAWALVVYGAFTTVSFLAALVRDGKIRLPVVVRLDNRVFNVAGAFFGLFIAGYTGVLLSVSNQPVWSDTWALGGLFLASGLSGSAALLMLLTRFRPEARPSSGMLSVSERLYALLELVLITVFTLTLVAAGTSAQVFGPPWILLWVVVLSGLIPGLYGLATERLSPSGAVALRHSLLSPLVVLCGVLALRAVVIFSVQV